MDISGIGAWVMGSKVGVAVGGVAGGIAVWGGLRLAKSYLPGLVAKWIGKEVDVLLQAGDNDDDALVLAVCRWAEAKIGPGKGEEKAALVAEKIAAMVPAMASRQPELKAIIQAVFDKSREVINTKK